MFLAHNTTTVLNGSDDVEFYSALSPKSLVFIDSKVSDYENLLGMVLGNVEKMVIPFDQDGVEFISEVLKTRLSPEFIHIISHGEPGCLYLGNTQLSLKTLNNYTKFLKYWFGEEVREKKLASNLYLYGCQLASSDAGKELISQLSQITGATIFASSSPTGSASVGGNWQLEIMACEEKIKLNHAPISLPFCEERLLSYSSILMPTRGIYNTAGKANKVAVVGNFAYVADYDKGLQIIDITNPTTPVLKATYDTSGYAHDLKIVGNYAYVTDGYSGLLIIDISNPASPVLKGSYNTAGYAHSVTIVGNYAYVADDLAGLQIIDITNPAVPVRKGIYDTTGAVYSVTVVGNYAYIADWESGLLVIDITNPTTPILKGTYKTSGSPSEVAVKGNYAYVVQHNALLEIIDISNPNSLKKVGSYKTADAAYEIKIVNNYAYIATNNAGVEVLDISNPVAPILKGSYDTEGAAVGVSVAGNSVYVADLQSGLQILEVNPSDWTKPAPTDITLNNNSVVENSLMSSVVGTLATTHSVTGETFSYSLVSGAGDSDNNLFTIVGNKLLTNKIFDYESQNSYSIRVRTTTAGGLSYSEQFTINITNQKEIIFKGTYNTPNLALGVKVVGKYAYLADWNTGLQIIDISDPSTLSPVSTYDTVGTARNVTVGGQIAYVADGSEGIQIIDISNPLSPTLKATYDTNFAHGLTIVDNYLYVADGYSGLLILDVTNPNTPILKGTANTSGYAREVRIVGQIAYIADVDSGLQIIDISNKNAPIIVGNYNTPGKAYDVTVVGNYAYVADENSGLQIIDISNKSAPKLVGVYDTSGAAQNVIVVGQYAFVADGESGLQIINISNPTVPTLAATYNTPNSAVGVSVLGNYAYVADANSGLHSFDVSEFTNSSPINPNSSNNTTQSANSSSGLSQITPVATTPSGDYQIDGLLQGSKWNFSWGNRTLTYSFYSDSVFNGSYYNIETGVKEVSEGVKNNYRKIFNWLNNVININFVEVTESPNNHGRIQIMSSDNAGYAYAYYPTGDELYSVVGDIHLNPNFDRIGDINGFQESAGYHAYAVLIHEVGHTLGLKHPIEGNDNTTLPVKELHYNNTLMGGYGGGVAPGTFMLYDIKALQYLYGAKQYNATNTTYQFSSRVDKFSVNGQVFLDTPYQVKQLLWDSGGVDTFDFSNLSLNASGYHLDLNPGGILTPQSDYNTGTYTVNEVTYTTSTYGTVIAYNVLIEDVINSSSNDEIWANSAANTFKGYSRNRQTGNDIYWNTNNNDTLDLSAYYSSEINQTKTGNDLTLKLGNNGTITVKNYYQGNALKILLNTLSMPSLSINDVTFTEGNNGITQVIFTVKLSAPSTQTVTVSYNTANGTALAGSDYLAKSGFLTFNPGISSQTLNLEIYGDNIAEQNENFFINLSNPIGATLADSQGIGTINNDDLPLITLAFNPSSVTEDGTTNLVYTFTRTGVTTNALTANFTVGGTATFNNDYTQTGAASFSTTTGTVTFAAGSSTATVIINPTTDTTIESNETVALTLSSNANYTVGTPTAVTGTIINDDPTITLAVAPSSVTEDGTTNLVYTFTRTGVTTNALTANFTVGGTATFNNDYTQTGAASFSTTTGTVTFAAGSSTATVIINPTTDTTIESNETVALTLSSNANYTVGTPTAVTGTIINDDFPTLSLNNVTVVEGKDANAIITFTLSSAISQAISVNYTISPISASANLDYTPVTGSLVLAANTTTTILSIPILNDNQFESDETFRVTLSNPVNVLVSTGGGTVTITDTLSSNITTTLPAGVENLQLTGTASINGTANEGNNRLTGNSANNILTGGNGNDIYLFNASTPLGNDTISETTTGGIDTLDFTATTAPIRVNLGITTLQTVVSNNLKLSLSANNVLENVIGGNGGDLIVGNSLSNDFTGGGGNDTLVGGAGSDKFRYQTGRTFISSDIAIDTLIDFTVAIDKIVLSQATFSTLKSALGGGLLSTDFAVVNDDELAATSTGLIVYSSSTGSLFYNQNGSLMGLGTGGEFASLPNLAIAGTNLAATDFLIV